MEGSDRIRQLVDHLFRRQSGRMVAALTRILGASSLDLAESVVQEALIQAMQSWPHQGVPEKPEAWLAQVARNRAIDAIRHDRLLADKENEIREEWHGLGEAGGSADLSNAEEAHFDPLLRDDALRMLFTCCHPLLPSEARVALTLKTVCGLGAGEISRAFLCQVEAIEQRLARAKRKIRDERVPFEVPEPARLPERLDSVLETLYLVFNEGYAATRGDELVRRELCEEAIRLAKLVVSHPFCSLPKTHALLALMLLHGSRLGTRTDGEGELLLLEEQDRSRWDRAMIQEGVRQLALSARGEELSDYHLQASIASCHALAPSFEETDWERILSDYDELVERTHSPVAALNRAVAVMMARGPRAALEELERIRDLPPMRGYFLLPAALAEAYRRLGDAESATRCYEQALALAANAAERRFLMRRLEQARRGQWPARR